MEQCTRSVARVLPRKLRFNCVPWPTFFLLQVDQSRILRREETRTRETREGIRTCEDIRTREDMRTRENMRTS